VLVRYTFHVTSDLRLDDFWPIGIGNRRYEFKTNDNNEIESISVTVREEDEGNWPRIVEEPEADVKLHFFAGNNKDYGSIVDDILIAQGMLSLYRQIDIDYENSREEWIPENQYEEKSLKLTGFERLAKRPPTSILPYDIVARSFLCLEEARSLEILLTFVRQGNNEIDRNRYINAFYNYYFFIETLYGDGKFKKEAILSSFFKSNELVDGVRSARAEFLKGDRAFKGTFFDLIRNTESPNDLLKYIVDQRGFLHHHTIKRRDIWHPERQQQFEVEAIFMQLVCHGIAFSKVSRVFFQEKHEKGYYRMSEEVGAIFVANAEINILLPPGIRRMKHVRIRVPGTKATHRIAEYLAKQVFSIMERSAPVDAILISFEVKAENDGTVLCAYKNMIDPV
jgi:hypothetical protein